MTFNLQDILSSQTVNLNESGVLSNEKGTLFSNPSFREGCLVDVEYIATTVDVDNESVDRDEVPTEKFSLIQLISKIVATQTAPLLKQINELESANKTLKIELDAFKAENAVVASVSGSRIARGSLRINWLR